MAILGRGTTFAFEVTGGTSFTVVVNLVSIDGPNITNGEVETTLLNSTFKPYSPTIPEGECTLNIRHVNSDATCMALQALNSVPIPNFTGKITWEDGYVSSFTGFSKGYQITGTENEGVVNAAIPIRMLTPLTTTSS